MVLMIYRYRHEAFLNFVLLDKSIETSNERHNDFH